METQRKTRAQQKKEEKKKARQEEQELNTLDITTNNVQPCASMETLRKAKEKLEQKKAQELKQLQQQRKKNMTLIRNRLLIEDGQIQYQCNNRYGLRIQNFRKFGPGAIGSLDTYIQTL